MQTDYGKEFGERLAKALSDQPKQQIAAELGCSDVSVRLWMKGKIPFAICMLKSLHDVYEIDLNNLIAGDKNEQKKT
ncbi:hypothetical protein LCGC14_1979880 [marine sediment metagenome]|uniref:HTH cro/C1-type domain-containing protein n=1 Tax=marine sediment metagenome TaxID=412755 RepID=A0A0F9I672_9ZZZZ